MKTFSLETSDEDEASCIAKDPMAYARGQKRVEYDSSDGDDSLSEDEMESTSGEDSSTQNDDEDIEVAKF